MKYRFLICCVPLAIVACGQMNRGNADGGPCSYESTPYPATVLEVDTAEVGLYNLLMAFEFGEERDTMWFYDANNNYVPQEDMERYEVKPGSSCSYVHKQITEGHCNPEIFVFSPAPYKGRGGEE